MKQAVKKALRFIFFPLILTDYIQFIRDSRTITSKRFSIGLTDVYPCLRDKTFKTGFDRHYVYHTSWAARILAETRPEKHIDIASSLYFAGIASAFVPVDFYDYRPADIQLSNLESKEGDLVHLPFADNSLTSLSCMHVIEHIGLGRYGEPIDYNGDIKATKELSRILAPNGNLIFVTPVGCTAKIEFNAHRIYSYQRVLELFPELTLQEFTLIPERSGSPIRNADPSLLTNEHYACGCFVFTKK